MNIGHISERFHRALESGLFLRRSLQRGSLETPQQELPSWSIGWCPPPFGDTQCCESLAGLGSNLAPRHRTIWLLDATFQWPSRSTSARYQKCLHQHPGENPTVGGQDHAAAPNWCPAGHPGDRFRGDDQQQWGEIEWVQCSSHPLSPPSAPPCSEPDRNQREEVGLCR